MFIFIRTNKLRFIIVKEMEYYSIKQTKIQIKIFGKKTNFVPDLTDLTLAIRQPQMLTVNVAVEPRI